MPKSKTRTRLTAGAAITVLAVSFVGAWEGLKLNAYHDIVGIPTVCYGETLGVKLGQSYTKAECDDMLIESLQKHEAGMRACLKAPDAVPEKAYVAFVSATYNIGVGGFCKSSMARHLNANNPVAACNSLLLWNKAGGKEVNGLTNRRKQEQKLCLEGYGK